MVFAAYSGAGRGGLCADLRSVGADALRATSPAADHLERDVLLRLAEALLGALPYDEAHARAVVASAELGIDAELGGGNHAQQLHGVVAFEDDVEHALHGDLAGRLATLAREPQQPRQWRRRAGAEWIAPARTASPDGQPLSRWNAQSLRSQIALVAQDDCLLQGTIAENISGFDEQIDLARVRECASLAQISTDIERMPMGYESLVGDVGAAFPRMLILDEGTAQLDLENGRAVNAALSALAITRLVITLEGGVARETSGVLHQQQEMMSRER